jgi:hypothetical protein
MKTFSPTSPQQSFEDRLLEELLAMQASLNIPSPTRRLARWSGPRHVIAVGLAAAAAIVVALQVLPGSVNAPPAASAAGELEKLSSAALSGTPQILGPGQYVYTEEISNSGPPAHLGNDAYNVQFDVVSKFWVAADGSGRSDFTFFNMTFPTPRDRAAWVAQGRPDPLSAMSRSSSFGPGNYGPMRVNEFTLPTQPAPLATAIDDDLARVTHSRPGTRFSPEQEFGYIGQLLHERAAPPKVRAALLTLAEKIPGIVLIGSTTAPEGMSGVGIASRVQHGDNLELVFNPTTGALVAYEQWQTNSSGRRTLAYWDSYLASGVVNSTSATIPAAK